MLSSEESPRVLVNTFDALEFGVLRILKHVTMVGIEPSIPSMFLNDNIFRDDMIEINSKNYMDWLNSKDKGSVIYIEFGSYSKISSQLIEEIGWNLTLESIASKVPIVACPLWNDQVCNAKLIQDIWKNGVRVNVSEGGVVERDEFNRWEELRRNVKKWSDLAKEAMKENGTSSVNLKAFANEILLGHNEY
ncbi:hypothetical protein H5410_004571 [Solanum commersonii]|uniref:Uncharacterized protein n=1 Tax=Solanum commersonii TaxID=4109 RepID=A0A9J6B836_SOLCO|nr:hypothetical protein H5410_004571 [Solanum commersonii]